MLFYTWLTFVSVLAVAYYTGQFFDLLVIIQRLTPPLTTIIMVAPLRELVPLSRVAPVILYPRLTMCRPKLTDMHPI